VEQHHENELVDEKCSYTTSRSAYYQRIQ